MVRSSFPWLKSEEGINHDTVCRLQGANITHRFLLWTRAAAIKVFPCLSASLLVVRLAWERNFLRRARAYFRHAALLEKHIMVSAPLSPASRPLIF